jgi:hypothetical protein
LRAPETTKKRIQYVAGSIDIDGLFVVKRRVALPDLR